MRRNKYNNKRWEALGITFDSKREASRYFLLKGLEDVGKINSLELQPVYVLQEGFIYNGKKVRPITYRADFRYIVSETGEEIVEDVKGVKTDVYRIKKKLFLKRYGDKVTFMEV